MTDSADTTQDKTKAQATLIDSLETAAKSSKPSTANPKAIAFTEQIPPRDYDIPTVENFLDKVFHAATEDNFVLTWLVTPTGSPSYPKSEDYLVKTLSSTKKPYALYYGTATCKRHEDGKLYNRKALFNALHVVVLDDIGTKVPFDKIPADFTPSYKLETSEGNFQYGYILAEPIHSLSAAEAIIQLVYESGCSDEGGKMPNKLVRIPEGVNGKQGKGGFISTITEESDVVYTPQEILDALQLNARWEDVLLDAESVTKKRASKSLGATPWSTTTPFSASLSGMIDPVLEWLYANELVTLDNGGEWVEITCPWSAEHSTGETTAGYIPIGRGDDPEQRAFNCFHNSCVSNKTDEFLISVAAASGIEVGRRDPAAALTARFVFDHSANSAWDIKAHKRDTQIAMTSFANLYPHKTPVYGIDGKPKNVGMSALWKTAASRVVVAGATYDPSTTARIVKHHDALFVNLFSIPEWGHGPIDFDHIVKFQEYVSYLIPDEEQRDYFLHWVAAKVQDMSFRGAAIVMVANTQGVGRSTMADMLKTLIGETNTVDVPLKEMLGDSQFNAWREKPFVVVDETLAADPKTFYSNYEKLKTLVDPRTSQVTINPKYGMQRSVTCNSSYLFLSNHANALALPAEDRRFYVIENAVVRAPPAYFTGIGDWMAETDDDGMPTWGRSVFRWLLTQPVVIEDLLAPPPRTVGKAAMADEALSNLDFAVIKLLNLWPLPYITTNQVYDVLRHPTIQGPLRFDDDVSLKYVKRGVIQGSTAYKGFKVKVDGKSTYPRALNRCLASTEALKQTDIRFHEHVMSNIRITPEVCTNLAGKLLDMLEENGRI